MAEKMIPLKLLKDTWDDDGNRCAAGMQIKLPTKQAKEAIKSGVAERNDPLTGDE